MGDGTISAREMRDRLLAGLERPVTNPQTDEIEWVALIEQADKTAEALSAMVDRLFGMDQREAGLLVSQASASVEALMQVVRAMDTRRENEVLREALERIVDRPGCSELYEKGIGSIPIDEAETMARIAAAALTNTLTVVGDGQ